METHTASPAASVGVAQGATLDIYIGTGSELLRVEHVVHTTCCAGCIDILADGAAEQGYICGAIDIAATRISHFSIPATVGIAYHRSTLVDDDVGVVFPAGVA